jgi:hypothetical protein
MGGWIQKVKSRKLLCALHGSHDDEREEQSIMQTHYRM